MSASCTRNTSYLRSPVSTPDLHWDRDLHSPSCLPLESFQSPPSCSYRPPAFPSPPPPPQHSVETTPNLAVDSAFLTPPNLCVSCLFLEILSPPIPEATLLETKAGDHSILTLTPGTNSSRCPISHLSSIHWRLQVLVETQGPLSPSIPVSPDS